MFLDDCWIIGLGGNLKFMWCSMVQYISVACIEDIFVFMKLVRGIH